MWPIWYEYPDRDASRIDYMPFGAPASIGIDDTARLTVTDWTGETLDGLDATDIIPDDEQTIVIPEPVTQFTIQGKNAKSNDGALEFDEHETELTALGLLPANLTITQSSITVESDVVSADTSEGVSIYARVIFELVETIGRHSPNCSSRWTGDCARTPSCSTAGGSTPPYTHASTSPPAADRSSSKETSPHGSPETTQNRRRAACGPASAAPLPINGLPANPTYATRSHYGLYQ